MLSAVMNVFFVIFLGVVGAFRHRAMQQPFLSCNSLHIQHYMRSPMQLHMNFFSDAIKYFSNLKMEASAKHILLKGDGARERLLALKSELLAAPDVLTAFTEAARNASYKLPLGTIKNIPYSITCRLCPFSR